TGHGIRATISTALNEIGYPKVWVDAQLSHVDPNKVSATYNHAEYVEQRRRMMQDWADRLDLLEQNQVEAASVLLTSRAFGRWPARRSAATRASLMATASCISTPRPATCSPTSASRITRLW